MPEAQLEDFGSGLTPVTQGWFVVNVRVAEWWNSERRGARCGFENEYGDAPVAPFRLPGRHQWDFAVSKNVKLGGTTRLQLRADFINAFNQTQFLDVNTSCVGTTTCERPGGTFGQVTSTHPPREIQLGVRFNW